MIMRKLKQFDGERDILNDIAWAIFASDVVGSEQQAAFNKNK